MHDSPTVLCGTASRAKLAHLRAVTQDLNIRLLSLADAGIALDVAEDGDSVEANARIKATAYAQASRLPTIAIDAGLYIDAFAPTEQPGVNVRRVNGPQTGSVHAALTDAQLIAHYAQRLQRVGGESSGRWQVAVALAVPGQAIRCHRYAIETRFTAIACAARITDAPLSSLMVDPHSGRYYAEMAFIDRPDSRQLRATLLELFRSLPIRFERK